MKEQGLTQLKIGGTMGAGQMTVTGENKILACSAGEIQEALLNQGGTGTAKVKVTGCVLTDSKGNVNPNCTVYSNPEEKEPGTVIASGSGAVIKGTVNGKYYFKASAGVGSPFTTIYMVGAKCTQPEETEYTGSLALRIPAATTESVTHTVEKITTGDEVELGVELRYGTNKILLEPGAASTKLLGAQEGLNWSFK